MSADGTELRAQIQQMISQATGIIDSESKSPAEKAAVLRYRADWWRELGETDRADSDLSKAVELESGPQG